MNVPDLRDVDFDAYRQRAADLRAQAIDESIDRVMARIRSLIGIRPAVTVRAARTASAHCPA